MSFREQKGSFLHLIKERIDADLIIRSAKITIECLIDNEESGFQIPIVFVCNNDKLRQKILDTVCDYYKNNKSNLDPVLNLAPLDVSSNSSNQSLAKFIQLLVTNPSVLYWAKSKNWFSLLPSGLLHVVVIDDHGNATRYINQQKKQLAKVTRSHDDFNVFPALLSLIRHKNSQVIADRFTAQSALELELGWGVIRPIQAPFNHSFDDVITNSSDDWQKVAFLQIARYLSLEFKGLAGGYTFSSDFSHLEVHPVSREIRSGYDGKKGCFLIGAVAVNVRSKQPLLTASWLHPFFRRQKIMTGLWSDLTKKYGYLEVENPNVNMQNFLATVGHPQGVSYYSGFYGGMNPLL